ncbi:hypothetical protein, partial [Microbacterium lacticum]|uniref:hypothetical protein n=1 Tax=Microbacterium lacticum TaxID=33885 RepID=UPI001F5A32DA
MRGRSGDEVEDGVEQEKRDEERGHPSSLTADPNCSAAPRTLAVDAVATRFAGLRRSRIRR